MESKMMTKSVLTGVGERIGPRDPAMGEYSLVVPADRRCSHASADWRVVVRLGEHVVSRRVCNGSKPWPAFTGGEHSVGQYPDEVIWPAWPATLQEEIDASATPLSDLQAHWDQATGRLRDSAKWMATVIGASLAALIPTAPLAGLSKHLTVVPALVGLVGLLFISVTMVLVLQVMQPQSVDYNDIEDAKEPPSRLGRLRARIFSARSALYEWNKDIRKHADLYLPIGVNSLSALRGLMIVEELTLVAISRVEQNVTDTAVCDILRRARAARAARLHELRAAAASVVTLGVYYQVKRSSGIATYVGATCGFLGIILIVTAVAWPG